MTRVPGDRLLELSIGAIALVLATLAYLFASSPLGVLALVAGSMGYGLTIARAGARDR
jgi:hypothetical protein